jgi:MOSC domain-containing protein YiiM
MILTSINVGQIEQFGFEGAEAWFDQPWTTAIFKRPIDGPVRVGIHGLTGDKQADLTVHGGADKAVCAYSGDHYPAWKQELRLEDFDAGAFGENFTLAGLSEQDVCIGDVWSLGETELQVSQPRQPCWKLARKWRIKTLTAQTVDNGRTGWYFRVLREGLVHTRDRLVLVSRRSPEWTIAAANAVMHHRTDDAEAAGRLARVEGLSTSWTRTLLSRAGSKPGQKSQMSF